VHFVTLGVRTGTPIGAKEISTPQALQCRARGSLKRPGLPENANTGEYPRGLEPAQTEHDAMTDQKMDAYLQQWQIREQTAEAMVPCRLWAGCIGNAA